MKKFYAQIFIAAFLLAGFCSQAQLYTSINPNPSNFTFDDPRYWVGEVRPPNPCTGCVINVNSTTWMPNSKPLTLVPSTAQPTATNVFTVQTPPGTAHLDAPGALTVGMRFQSSVPGQI